MEDTAEQDMKKILAERVDSLTTGPGVYLMKDEKDEIIYVGKAKNLKKRVASYFKRENYTDMKTGVLVKKIVQFDTILTGTEKEALILEANLIRNHKPRYNVILKDDKRYPFLRIDVTSPYPNITITRKIKKDGALYFGPYTSAGAVHQTIKFINKTFKLRKCNTRVFRNRTRPCLNYQIGVCLAPCCFEVDTEVYRAVINEVTLFLKGKTPDLIRQVKRDMTMAADAERYEEAAQLRDKLIALEQTLEKQVVVSGDTVDRDVIAVSHGENLSLITLLSIRGGGLSGSRHFSFTETIADDAELIRTFIMQYYETAVYIPGEIMVSVLPDDHETVADWLKTVKMTRVNLIMPQRGEKMKLVDMARNNGQKELEERENKSRARMDLVLRLKKKLETQHVPFCIECFDNSNISGTEPVSGMVVFKNGKPFKPGYRKYRIRTVETQDDYSYMQEVLRRRYNNHDQDMAFPDLLMVDGGKGQLNIAVSVLREAGIEGAFDVIGIAKKDESKGETQDKIFKPGRANPINFSRNEDLLLFLQSIRDEAHRFAVSFHRKRRTSQSLVSALDSIPGIGSKRKKNLLVHFGSVQDIRNASIEELTAVEGMTVKAAKDLLNALNEKD